MDLHPPAQARRFFDGSKPFATKYRSAFVFILGSRLRGTAADPGPRAPPGTAGTHQAMLRCGSRDLRTRCAAADPRIRRLRASAPRDGRQLLPHARWPAATRTGGCLLQPAGHRCPHLLRPLDDFRAPRVGAALARRKLHRVLSHLIVTTDDGEEWPAFLGGLAPWLKSQGADRYFVRWRANARESRGLGLFALPHVVPAMVLQMLGSGNAVIVPQLMASIGGVPQHREHNVLDELVRRSLALVIDRNLLASADRYGKPQYGSHLERYLVDALRRLAAGHSAWAVNRDKSRVWLGPEGLFLVWPGAAEDVLALLENDQLVGIPKSPQTLLELLLEAGVLVAAEAARQTWAIQPPGAKAPMEAVKLTSAAILLAGLEPPPCALDANLLPPPSDSNAQSPAPPAATPTPAAPAAPKVAPSSAPGASGIQLLLIDPPAEKTAHDPALLNAASPNED